MAVDTYITTGGCVALHHKDGTTQLYRYGDPVDKSLLADSALANIDRHTGDNPGIKREVSLADQINANSGYDTRSQLRAAMADHGQPGSTSSPIPSNYDDLTEDETIRFLKTLDQHPGLQAVVVEYELRGENRSVITDAVSDNVRELASIRADQDPLKATGPDTFSPGSSEAVAEVTETDQLPPPPPVEEPSFHVPAGRTVTGPDAEDPPPPAAEETTESENTEPGVDLSQVEGDNLTELASRYDVERGKGKKALDDDELRAAIAEKQAAASTE